MSLISATHWVKSKHESGFHAGETRTFGSKSAAVAWAESVVPECVTTRDCYWRDTARAEHVEFTSVRRGSRPNNHGRYWRSSYAPAGRFDARVILVPSVGELGYW